MAKPVIAPMTEKQFQQWLMDLAKLYGWLAYHTHRSQYSAAGFPDTVLLKNGRCIVAELKVGKNAPTTSQAYWLREFALVDGIEVYTWWPENRGEIEATLAGKG